MNEVERDLNADILFLFEAKSTGNVVHLRVFLTKNKDKSQSDSYRGASLKPLKSH